MTNLSKQKREALEGKIELLRSKLDATDVEAQNALFALEAELKHKKYGLVWEEHEEEIDRTLSENLPVLTEQTELAVNAGGLTHFLLEGDNLAALEILKRTHKGKIDVIYIDPPYNTGNKEFVYADHAVGIDDAFRHSKWLSFMEKRLEAAKELLTSSGVIFISIDDNEQSQLKILCDEIFGEGKFVATIPWRKRTAKSDVPSGVSQDYEYILCYANEYFWASVEGGSRRYYETDDFPGRPWRHHDLTTQRTIQERPNSNFTIVNPKNGKKYPVNPLRCWAVTKDTFDDYLNENRIIFPGDYDFMNISRPVLRYWQEDDKKKDGDLFGRIAVSSKLPDEVGMSQDGTKDVTAIFKKKAFSYPKPASLIKFLIQISTYLKPNATVLDFFAGSGTTGQAVLELNEEDGGSRQFILCTNNENNICRNITYERMKTVITGKRQDGSAYSDGIAATLKYDKIDYVAVKEDGDILLYDDYADALLAHVREMVELENGISFESDSTIKICLYEDELDEFVDALDEKSEVRAVYVGHDLLMTAQQKAKLAALNVAVNIIPQYYYEDEV